MGKTIKQLLSFFVVASVTLAAFWPALSFAISSGDYVNGTIYNNIISDSDFLNINSMTASDIQSFLTAKSSYLAGFSEGGRTAAQIIYDAAHGANEASGTFNGITVNTTTGTVNPEVLLVTLQKEQSLTTRSDYNSWAMLASMGYACYPSVSGDGNGNGCADAYEGFTKQVENGAWQLRYSFERSQGKGLDYQVGQTYTSSDGYTVTFMNAATASLYRYTPYVFNGNYNFYNLFTSWFTTHVDTAANDTNGFTLLTYTANQSISGSKTSTSTVALDGNQIASAGSTTWTINLTGLAIGTNSHAITYIESGAVVGTKQITITVQKSGDINGDNYINIQDLSILANYWNVTNPEAPLSDLNGDHVVNISDLSILAGRWGQ